MKLSIALFTLCFLSFNFLANSQVIINEINVDENWVELYNTSNVQTVNVSNLRLCRRPAYATISNLTVLSGNTSLAPGAYVVIEWNQINTNQNELGLYKASGGYGATSSILDYVQYGGVASPTRALTAVNAGVWNSTSSFVPYPLGTNTLQNFNTAATGASDTNRHHWGEAAETESAANNCIDAYTLMTATRIFDMESGNADYETKGILESQQIIKATAIVDYDSALEILLTNGFEVQLGASFEAFIDGCNQGAGGIHN